MNNKKYAPIMEFNKENCKNIELEKILPEEEYVENTFSRVADKNIILRSDVKQEPILYKRSKANNCKNYHEDNIKMQIVDDHNVYIEVDEDDEFFAMEENDNLVIYICKYISKMLH
jgi:hypothetical protein